ncbi:hypothetical protein F4680DRAFT_447408 [Xylaria scruposa]|nr:hypothetical protein F4680DRAFT_447408 [Xylaria scruposa]
MSRLQGEDGKVQDQSLDIYEGRYEGEEFGYHSQYHYAASARDLLHGHENKTVPKSLKQEYKPTALRWTFLLTLLLALLTTLAFLIYATIFLPIIGSRDALKQVEARGQYQPFSLIGQVLLPIHTSTIKHKTQRTEAATGKEVSLTSSLYYTPTESHSAKGRSRARSVILVSVLRTTILDFDDGHIVGPAAACDMDIRALDISTAIQSDVLDGSSDDSKALTFASVNSDAHGHIGTETITESLLNTATNPTLAERKAWSFPGGVQTKGKCDYGRIGTKTVTESVTDTPTSPTFAESQLQSDFGKARTNTVTKPLPYTYTRGFGTKTEGGFGRIGTKAATESVINIPMSPTFTENKLQSDFNKIRTKTVTKASLVTTTSLTGSTTNRIPIPESEFGSIESKTINQSTWFTTQLETETHGTIRVTTIIGGDRSPVATSKRTASLKTWLKTSLPTHSDGQATATQVTTVTIAPSTFGKTDSAGDPTTTAVNYPVTPPARTAVYIIGSGQYFIGTFLPTLIASILATAVQILNTNVKSFQPWHALTHEQGASGRNSLCFETGGWRSLAIGLRLVVGGYAVVFLASLLSLLSAVLIPISAGAIILDLRGDGCKKGGSSASNCAYVLSVSPIVAKVAISILGAMSLTTIVLVILIGRWRLGVYTNPWSMCTLASLSTNPKVRQLILDDATGAHKLKHQDFKLDYFSSTRGSTEYGVVAFDRFNRTVLSSTYEGENTSPSNWGNDEGPKGKHGPPFFMLGIIGRLYLLFFLSGVLVLVLYYALTGGDTAFERFIDGDSFGLRFLFTSLGVIIGIFWSAFNSAVAITIPYLVLTERPREASQSVLLAPPTNAFSGLWHAVRTRRLFLGAVSIASILSQSLSIFLSNVPFRVTQTFLVSQLSIWTSVGIMSFMLLILLTSFFVKWPNMPVKPGTIAGAMYYVCNTSTVDMFESLSTLGKEDRDRTVTDMALLYELRETMSAAGSSSIGLQVLRIGDPYPGESDATWQ